MFSFTKAMENGIIPDQIRTCFPPKIQNGTRVKSLSFYEISIDEPIASALEEVLRRLASVDAVMSTFELYSCPDSKYLQRVLRACMKSDVIERYLIGGRNPAGESRIRRWMDIPPWERPIDPVLYHQPSLQPFSMRWGESEVQRSNRKQRNPIGFTLCNFELSHGDIRMLRNGVLSPKIGNLEKLTMVNIKFLDDESVRELGEAIAERTQCSLSQDKRTETPEMASFEKQRLRQFTLNFADLSDEPLSAFVRTLMVPSTTFKGRMRSSLTHLDISGNNRGRKCLRTLGTWLFNIGSSHESTCSCSLEALNLSESKIKRPRSLPRFELGWKISGPAPISSLTSSLEAKPNSYDLSCVQKNDTLKKLILRGISMDEDEMEYLGRLVALKLPRLEELDLEDTGLTDRSLARFTAAISANSSWTDLERICAKLPSPSPQRKIGKSPTATVGENISLQILRLDRNRDLTQLSSTSIVTLLERFPRLRSIPLRSRPKLNQIRHLLNVNECGRALLFCAGPRNDDNPIPISVWSLVFERINRMYRTFPYNPTPLPEYAANGIYYLIRNNAAMLNQYSSDALNFIESNCGSAAEELTKKRKRSIA